MSELHTVSTHDGSTLVDNEVPVSEDTLPTYDESSAEVGSATPTEAPPAYSHHPYGTTCAPPEYTQDMMGLPRVIEPVHTSRRAPDITCRVTRITVVRVGNNRLRRRMRICGIVLGIKLVVGAVVLAVVLSGGFNTASSSSSSSSNSNWNNDVYYPDDSNYYKPATRKSYPWYDRISTTKRYPFIHHGKRTTTPFPYWDLGQTTPDYIWNWGEFAKSTPTMNQRVSDMAWRMRHWPTTRRPVARRNP